jgi:hypothetical protein
MLGIPLCLDNRFRDDSNVLSTTHRPRSAPQKHYILLLVLISVRLSKPQGLVRPEGSGKLKKKKKIIHLIGSRTSDLSACSTVPLLSVAILRT